LAAHQKKAALTDAHLVLIDESGLLMAPLVKRTWAPRGHRPTMFQKGKHREKVSLAGALWLSPERDRLGLIFQTLENAYFDNQRVASLLELLMREIANRLIVLWDRGGMHKGDPIRAEVERFRPRLSLELLPAYAPMLNPVERIWSWLKYGRLSNYAPMNAHELNRRVKSELGSIRGDQNWLRSFWHASDLPMPNPRKSGH
jgi:putative transposase